MLKWLLMIAVIGIALMLWRSTAFASRNLPKAGEPAPGFSLADQHGKVRTNDDFCGKWLVLYFYPRDDTPGCTKQACAFRDDMHKMTAFGAEVVGISVDTTASHAEFSKKYSLRFPLLADDKGAVARRYGSICELGFFKFARRNTFLIDPQGKVAKTYLSASTSRNSQEIIDDLRKLAGK